MIFIFFYLYFCFRYVILACGIFNQIILYCFTIDAFILNDIILSNMESFYNYDSAYSLNLFNNIS